MISGLTSRLSDLEGEVGEVGSLSDGYKVVQEELQVGILLFPTLFDSAKEWVLGCVTLASSFPLVAKVNSCNHFLAEVLFLQNFIE